MSLKHAILGFLSFKPLSGYDLKKAFDKSVRHFWPANQSQIYRTLAELEKENFIEKEIVPRDDDRLDMKIYHINETGREELHRWLSTPLPSQDYREPFLIQIYFAGQLSDSELLSLLQREIRSLEERLAIYISIYKMNTEKLKELENPRALFLSIATLEYGIFSNQTALEWLKRTEQRIQSGDYSLTEFQMPSEN